MAVGQHEDAVRLLQPFVLQQLEAGDMSFRMQVPGIYTSFKGLHWSERIAERIVRNLGSMLDRIVEDLRAAGDDGEKEEHVRLDLALGLALMAGLESNQLFREGEWDAFTRSGREDVWKVWRHGQKRAPREPRPNHVAMNGETVHCVIGEDNFFSNGGRWPADTLYLPVEEVVNCSCRINYVTEIEF